MADHPAGNASTGTPMPDPQFLDRALRYLEDEMGPLEFAQLKSEMSADPAKRRAFVQLCLTRAGLIEELRNRAQFDKQDPGPPGEAGITRNLSDAMVLPAIVLPPRSAARQAHQIQPEPRASQSTSFWNWPMLRVASVLLVIAIGALLWAIHHNSGKTAPIAIQDPAPLPPIEKATVPSTAPQVAAANPKVVPVAPVAPSVEQAPPAARVTVTLDAQLDADLSQNAILSAGLHTLEHGLVQLDLSTGATVVVQAPAQFEVLSESRITLRRGKLAAVVPHSPLGHVELSIETPDLKAVDLGTEFAVNVIPFEQTHLEVFKGTVRAETAADPAGVFASKVVAADQSVMVRSGTNLIQKDAPTPLLFVRSDELKSRAAKGGDSGFQRWQAFSKLLRQDPDLIAYYPFDNQTEAPDVLLNRAAVTAGKHDAALGIPGTPESRPAWTQGRWQGKSALQFGDNSSTVAIIPADADLTPTSAASISLWVRRTRRAKTEHLLEEADNDVNCFSLTFTGSAKQPPPRTSNSMYLNYTAIPADATRSPEGSLPDDDRWVFLTITRDSTGLSRCYVNGAEVSKGQSTIPDLRRAGDLWIGRSNPAARGTSTADIFHGQLDELALFRRALSLQEVQRMYEAGKPPASGQ